MTCPDFRVQARMDRFEGTPSCFRTPTPGPVSAPRQARILIRATSRNKVCVSSRITDYARERRRLRRLPPVGAPTSGASMARLPQGPRSGVQAHRLAHALLGDRRTGDTCASQAVLGLAPRLGDKSFHVRVHRRGWKGVLTSPDEARSLAAAVIESMQRRALGLTWPSTIQMPSC